MEGELPIAAAPGTGGRRPRMRDVAELAGVSTQTVSNFVNGRTAKLSPWTRARVGAAAEQLGYRAPRNDSTLARAARRRLGFLVLDDSERCLADPLTALYLSGLTDAVRCHGHSILVHCASESELLLPMLDREVAGACLVLSGPRAQRLRTADAAAACGLPFVVLDEVIPTRRRYPTVVADQRDGARQLVRHLCAAGHRRIAFVAAAAQWAVLEERYAGYRMGLNDWHLDLDSSLTMFEGGWEPDGTGDVVRRLLARPDPPTAFVCGSDLVALGAMRQVHALGLRVPEEIAVCGFDDFAFAPHASPPLSTVAVPAWEMGRDAGRMLLALLAGRVLRQPAVVRPVELRLRGSA